MTGLELAALIVLALWFAGSVAMQWRPVWLLPLRRVDRLHLLARYQIFAPDPPLHEVRLELGIREPDGLTWCVVDQRLPRSLLRVFWNPHWRAASNLQHDLVAIMERAHKPQAAARALHRIRAFVRHQTVSTPPTDRFRLVTLQRTAAGNCTAVVIFDSDRPDD